MARRVLTALVLGPLVWGLGACGSVDATWRESSKTDGGAPYADAESPVDAGKPRAGRPGRAGVPDASSGKPPPGHPGRTGAPDGSSEKPPPGDSGSIRPRSDAGTARGDASSPVIVIDAALDAPGSPRDGNASSGEAGAGGPGLDGGRGDGAISTSRDSGDSVPEGSAAPAPSCGDGFRPLRAGGPGYERPTSVAVAADGSVVVTGLFSDTAKFGDFTLSAAGGTDMFLVKYSPTGQSLWARRAGSITNDFGGAVAVTEHAIYVAGTITGTADFANRELVFTGRESMFLARYAHDGTLIWVQQFPEAFIGAGDHSIFALPNDDVFVTGSFAGNAQFGNASLVGSSNGASFLVHFDGSGSVVWASAGGGDGGTDGRALSVLDDGTVYLTGDLRGSAKFGDTTLGPVNGPDAFVAAYTESGSVAWARQIGSPDTTYVYAQSIAATKSGAVYATGEFLGDVHFGTQTLHGDEELFLVKYDRHGAAQWIRKATGRSEGVSLAALADGSVYVSGGFVSSVLLGMTTLTGNNDATAFVAKFSPTGTATWVQGATGGGGGGSAPIAFSWGRSIAVREGCAVALTGGFTESWSFDSVALQSAGDEDVFVTTFKP